MWPLQSGGRHQCRLDQYEAILRLETPDRYVMTYVVCGPRKGYVSRSVYTRVLPTDLTAGVPQALPSLSDGC